MALPEMKKPLYVGFKVGPNKMQLFQVSAWKARTDFMLEFPPGGGKPTCTCAIHKIDSKCPHQQAVLAPIKKAKRAVSEMSDLPDPVVQREAADFEHVYLYDLDNADNSAAAVKECGDLNAFNFVWLMSDTRTTEKTRMAGGVLNPRRIHAELKASCDKGIAINHGTVEEIGKKIKPLDADDDFDSSLADKHVSGDAPKAEDAPAAEEAPFDTEDEGKEKGRAPGGSSPFWKTRKRPDPAYFYVEKDVWEQAVYAVQFGKNCMLTGPSGSGKSQICYLVARACDRKLEAFNMGAMSEPRTALIGNTHFSKDKGTWFEESRFVRALRDPEGCLLLDEMSRAVRDAFNILLPLLDAQGYLALDESETSPVVHKGERCAFLGTANIGMSYTGTDAMDTALKDRFGITIDMFFPPRDNETKVLLGRCPGLKFDAASRLVEIATKQREMALSNEFIEMISTRMLIEAGEQIGAGMDFKTACKFTILNRFDGAGGDASERTKVSQIIQKGG